MKRKKKLFNLRSNKNRMSRSFGWCYSMNSVNDCAKSQQKCSLVILFFFILRRRWEQIFWFCCVGDRRIFKFFFSRNFYLKWIKFHPFLTILNLFFLYLEQNISIFYLNFHISFIIFAEILRNHQKNHFHSLI